jgi:hypothetical protein
MLAQVEINDLKAYTSGDNDGHDGHGVDQDMKQLQQLVALPTVQPESQRLQIEDEVNLTEEYSRNESPIITSTRVAGLIRASDRAVYSELESIYELLAKYRPATGSPLSSTNTAQSDDSDDSNDSSGTTRSATTRTTTSRTTTRTITTTTTGHNIERLGDDVGREISDVEDPKPLITTDDSLPLVRKRGRPRKHPISQIRNTSHIRSETGCATCRRRKKRCDERKPGCLACEKNNVVCEGYDPKQQWRGGKERTVAIQANNQIPPSLPLLVNGVDGEVDQLFFQHFICNISKVLSVNDYQNPFLEHIVPMSMSHTGLMHSLLSLSGSCLVAKSPNINWAWAERQTYHVGKAMGLLSQELQDINEAKASQDALISNPSIAQTLILCLETVCSGDRTGLYRVHLNALKAMLTQRQHKFPNEQFRQFILEFLLYHDYSASITASDYPLDQRSLDLMADFHLPEYTIGTQTQTPQSTLLGVHDGLFGFISRIRALRDKIRSRRALGLHNCWDDPIINDAFAIENALRAWSSAYTPDSPRYAASLLYRQCAWVYLHRTIQLSRPSAAFKQAVDEGLTYLHMLPDTSDGSIQSILLMPVFLLGCAAFEPEQRPAISAAFARLQDWSGLGNISYAQKVVEQIWGLMDEGREQETWDWEKIIKGRGWDFLIT